MCMYTVGCLGYVIKWLEWECEYLEPTQWCNCMREDYSYWEDYSKEKITAIERVQRRATKFILKNDLSYPERLVTFKLLPLEYRREILDLCFFFKCLKEKKVRRI